MSYAVLHVDKISGSCTAITRHIERSSQPDNAHPELAHLNRSDFIKYPEGVTTLNEAIRHRIDHAGLTRKVGKNQVLALAVLLTSDGEAFDRLQKEGSFEDWVQTSVEWVKKKFGKENVVAAHLHMDEQTPHLHVTVVPIVTTERKRKASEANVKRRYRTKPKGGARLCANDIMTRETLEHLQDEYAEEMERFGLERGIRGSEARHVSQHEYYRDCMVKKKGLEKDVAELSTEKKKLDKEKKSLESKVGHLECSAIALDAQRKQMRVVNEEMRQANSELYSENIRLTEANSSLAAENKLLADTNAGLSEETSRLSTQRENLAADTERLTAEKKAYEAQTTEARQEAETAMRERDEAKAERDAQRKEAVSNIANIFTGSKTKRLEAEVARKDNEIRELKDRAEAREQDFRREMSNLSDSLRRQEESEASTIRIHNYLETDLNTFFPDVLPLLEAARECREVGLSDAVTRVLLDQKPRCFNQGATIHSETYRQDFDVSNAEVQIKRNPTDNKFHLHINGTRVFQWLKEQWQRLKQTFSRGIRH